MLLIEQLLAKAGTTAAPTSAKFLYAWGHNNYGQLGGQDSFTSLSWTVVSGGRLHTAAIRSDNLLFTWGSGTSGQLGDGTAVGKSSPVQIGSSSWTAVSAAGYFTTAIRSGGTLFAWGNNTFGQLGDSTQVSKSSPVQIGSSSWTAVAAGFSHTAAIRSDGYLFTWGLNNQGQLGDGTSLGFNKSSPVQIGSSSWTAVASGQYHTAALRSGGTLFTWGLNGSGQLGDGTTTNRSSPVQIGSSSWTALRAGRYHCAAITSIGYLFTWGNNSQRSDGRLGDGTLTNRSSPVQIGSSSWTALAAGEAHTAAIRSDGYLFTWGYNFGGQLGDDTSGSVNNKSSPVQIGSDFASSSWTVVAAGSRHTVAITNNGTLFTWGLGTSGQLGDSTLVSKSRAQFISSSSWTAVAAGYRHTTAIRSGGTLFTWGYGPNGQLGDGTLVTKSSPVQIGSSSWTAVAAGGSHTAAIRSGGILFTWGTGSNGQLGDGTTAQKSSPVTVGGPPTIRSSPVQIGSSSWTAVAAGGTHAVAIRSDNLLFTWGLGTSGQLGDSTLVSKSSPVQIGSSSWTAVAAGDRHSVAIRSDNLLFAWGYNSLGSLGDGTNLSKSSPVQIGSSSWTAVAAGNRHTAAIRSDNLLFTWGLGTSGQLGDGTIVTKSSPVIVGSISSASWTNTSIGNSIIGAASLTASTTPTSGNNDDGYWTLTLPWNYIFNATTYTQVFVGTNQYLTFGAGSTLFNTLSASNPALDKIMYAAGDRSVQRIYSGTEGTAPNRTFRIRSEGNSTSSGTLGSPTQVFEFIFYENDTRRIDVQIGVMSTAGTGISGVYTPAGVSLVSYTPAANTGNNISNSGGGILTASSWTAVSAGISHTVAIRSDGTLFTWGAATNGTLGDGTLVSKSSPVQIGSSSWTAISVGTRHTAAIRSGGTLFTWGYGLSGQLGDGTTASKSSPVQIGSSSWTAVGAGGYFTTAVRSGGTLFTWGDNRYGQLGDNTIGLATGKSSPVQIGSSSWTAVSAGRYFTIAKRS